jgi:hypothetical protein
MQHLGVTDPRLGDILVAPLHEFSREFDARNFQESMLGCNDQRPALAASKIHECKSREFDFERGDRALAGFALDAS